MSDDILKIHCTTVTVCKNVKTGQVYKDEEEMKADVNNPDTDTTTADVQQDTTVQVSPKGLNTLQEFMNGKK
jgi:4-diphosphocytidyl-2C-methyl-D-erythritol kinase|tara:strand:- start:2275 stop:2490 length:216 start_codon:yes stop_codon:yes gene_type:complete